MRPEILYDLFKPVTTLSGVGTKLAKAIATAAGGDRIVDLLWHLPTGIVDRRYSPPIGELVPGSVATVVGTVESHEPPARSRTPHKVRLADGTGTLSLVFFHARADYLGRMLPAGERRAVSGRVERFGREMQMSHPDHIVAESELESLRRIEPVYGLSAGLSLKAMRKAIDAALELAPDLPEWLDEPHRNREEWPGWRTALLAAHQPSDETALEPNLPERRRLAYDELLANQLALALVRRAQRRLRGRSVRGDGSLQAEARTALAFHLTRAQETALEEIAADMASEERMLRLLQGDVGSGKTVVALLAMLAAVEAGCQAAFMAPTEILARQHYATIVPLAEAAGVEVALLTGRDKGKTRRAVLDGLASGSCKLAVGTHALFQEDVAFADLGLAVIDEQHRFGVHQRLKLAAKGRGIDVLAMTATPIPRTLTLTAYGDMDVSQLTEKPAGRQPVDTRVMPVERIDEVAGALERSIANGARVYWVCPLVEESERVDLAAAEDRFADLRARFHDRVGLVHGRMKGADRDAVMADFQAGRIDILVATTVIEVGVDVPEATVMVVEQADRFGLSQLHQLRGRIGRGSGKSTCLLLYGQPLSETARRRLAVMRETEDGFMIAEEDLKLRGAGELLGSRQSGMPQFRVADLAAHDDLLAVARRDAQHVLETDPELSAPRGEALRLLLYLFERDAAIRNLRSG